MSENERSSDPSARSARRPLSFLRRYFGGAPLVVANNLPATAVAAVWTPDHVVIAVDGKLTIVHTNEDGTMNTSYATTCKVIRRGLSAYVPAGISMDRLRKNIKDALEQEVALTRIHDPATFSEYRSGHPVLTLLIARDENQGPTLRVLTFFLDANQSSIVADNFFEGVRADQSPMMFYDQQEAASVRPPDDWIKKDHVEVARNQVSAMIRAVPVSDGPPISVFRIGKQGFEWVDQGKCNEKADNALTFDTAQP